MRRRKDDCVTSARGTTGVVEVVQSYERQGVACTLVRVRYVTTEPLRDAHKDGAIKDGCSSDAGQGRGGDIVDARHRCPSKSGVSCQEQATGRGCSLQHQKHARSDEAIVI